MVRFGLRAVFCGALPVFFVLHGSDVLAKSSGHDRETRAYNLAHGRVVFKEHCLRCHEKGRKGAPVPGNAADWSDRLDQPLPVLIAHAIEGHGDMPARGETELSDQEIASAVAYVVSRARIVLGEQVASQRSEKKAAGADKVAEAETVDEAVVRMFLLLMGKERWK